MNALTTNWALVRTALADDRRHRAGQLRIDDAAFLPAALEVIVPGARVEAALLYTAAARLIVLPEDQLAPVKRRLAGPEQSLGLDG